MIPKLQCSHCTRDYQVKRGSYRYCSACEKRFAMKDIAKDKAIEVKKQELEEQKQEVIRQKLREKIRVKCWHCGNNKQKIISYEKVFSCDKCHEDLWTGEGGYTEKSIGVYT